ncbi:MAG: DUF3800 domain-containing protein [Verrucomicrobia bacterium]|nr:DUF3800 domain-containing protein [Verrucomicrobiota bacterium]
MSTLKPSSLCLLVYLDETGQEELRDLQNPIFGMGGCAVLCSTAHRLLDLPWRETKLTAFGDREFAFHACSTLSDATPQQRGTIRQFFRDSLISRFAAVIRINTVLSPTLTPYQAISSVMFSLIEKVCVPYPPDSLALIFESSQRGDKLVRRWFSSLRVADENNKQLPVHFCFMDKAQREPGLEVADCIVNTAGRHVRHALRTGKREAHEMFAAIFQSVPRPLVHFIDVEAALIEKKK